MRLNILSDKVGWFGKESGYEPLTDYFPSDIDANILVSGKSFVGKLTGKILQVFFNWKWGNSQDVFKEFRFFLNCKKKITSHILYLEGHLRLVEKIGKGKKGIIGTIHMPIFCWDEKKLPLLNNFENVIILYKEEIDKFSKYISLDKIHFILLGINTNFFKPAISKPINKNKVLIVGHHMRNFEMLFEVYKQITNNPTIKLEFHIIIPSVFCKEIPILNEMSEYKNIFFHEKLSDQELLEQYQDSYVLLIPVYECGASTAIVQALAVGLPIITTDVGGNRSYGGGDIFPIVANNDVEGMVSLFNKYYQDSDFHDDVAKKEREFAVKNLDWKIIAQQHLDLYQSMQKK